MQPDSNQIVEPTERVPRSYEFWLVAYFLSRYGSPSEEGQINPPERLGVESWREAYDFFFDAINGGREEQSFRRSLKNARDSFDSHLEQSGRIGWRQTDGARSPAQLGQVATGVIDKWRTRPEFAIFERISEVVRAGRPVRQPGSAPPSPARLGTGRKVKTRSGNGARRSHDAYLVGKEAEEFVFDHLKDTLGSVEDSLRHHSLLGETPGYDISYVDDAGNRQAVEVKGTTASTFTSFELTANEFRASEELGKNYTIWLVTQVGNNPRIHTLTDPSRAREDGLIEVTPSRWLVEGFSIPLMDSH